MFYWLNKGVYCHCYGGEALYLNLSAFRLRISKKKHIYIYTFKRCPLLIFYGILQFPRHFSVTETPKYLILKRVAYWGKKIAIKMVIQDCKKIVLLTVLYLTFDFSDTKVFSLFVIIANVWHIWGFNPCKKTILFSDILHLNWLHVSFLRNQKTDENFTLRKPE